MNNINYRPILSFKYPAEFEGFKGVCPFNSDNICGKHCMKLVACEEYALIYGVCPVSNNVIFDCVECQKSGELFYACLA